MYLSLHIYPMTAARRYRFACARPLPCFLPRFPSSGVSRNPPSSRAFRAAWLMCLKRSGPRWIPPKYRVTTIRTLSTSCKPSPSGPAQRHMECAEDVPGSVVSVQGALPLASRRRHRCLNGKVCKSLTAGRVAWTYLDAMSRPPDIARRL